MAGKVSEVGKSSINRQGIYEPGNIWEIFSKQLTVTPEDKQFWDNSQFITELYIRKKHRDQREKSSYS